MVFWVLFIAISVLLFQVYEKEKARQIKDFKYSDFKKSLKKKHIDSVTFHIGTDKISGQIKKEFVKEYKGSTDFSFVGNIGDEGYKLVTENGITPNYEKDESSFFVSLFLNWLPLILIVALFFFLIRQIQVGGGKALSFGKSKARMISGPKNKTRFVDVAGIDEAREELAEVVDFLKNPRKFTKVGGKIPKGILLVGAPGTGKTLLARAIAGEAKVPFFIISGSDFVEMFVGVGASRVRDLFDQAKKNSPCLVFIDEIDAVGRHRGAGMGGGHDEREQTLNQLLVEMDGFEPNEGVILIAATNRPDVLDPALLRPGRFDRRIVVDKPDLSGRKKILEIHTKKIPLASNVNLEHVARGTPGFSGADLANLCNEAALHTARRNNKKVEMVDFETAKDKILMGRERRSMIMTDEDKKVTAYHEAGHALVGRSLKGLDPVHKVTIIPRGMALGVTQTLPERDEISLRKSKAKNLIAFLFGGRSAEEIIFKDYTTGAGNDIEKATDLARKMVCEWGMSDAVGPVSLGKSPEHVFLGLNREGSKDYSESKAKQVDEEIQRFVKEGHETATRILKEKKDILDALAKALLEFETIDGEEVDLLIQGKTLEEIRSNRKQRAQKLKKEQAEEKKDEKEKDIPFPIGTDGNLSYNKS